MAIISGRNGQVLWDPAGTTPVEIISLNAWTADFKTEYEDVTCFGDVNRVYIPGMKDAGGTLGGFFNSAELAVFEAAEQDTPGLLKLIPSTTEPLVFWTGPAYMDASIDASLSAPKLSGSWKAAGPFLLEGGVLSAAAMDARRRRMGRRTPEPTTGARREPAA
jgi:hypothetical protein